mgnify:FL=1
MWNLASGAGTISGIASETGQGSWSFPDGTLSVETLANGAVLGTITPLAGPAYSMVLIEGTVTQTAGDLVATVQSMPLSFSIAAGDQYASLGLALGLIEEVPPGGHFQQVPLAEQLWAGSRCNSATAKAAGSFLLMLANGAKCRSSGGLACAGLGGSALLLFSNLTDQKNICNNYSN